MSTLENGLNSQEAVTKVISKLFKNKVQITMINLSFILIEGGYEENGGNQYGPMPAPQGGYEELAPNNYPPPGEIPPIPTSYDNSNNIPINNYNPQGPPNPHHAPADYYDEAQPNEIYSAAASTNSKTTEKLPKETK